MKIKLEVDPDIADSEITIKCSEIDERIKELQRMLSSFDSSGAQIVFYKNEKEFYFPVNRILFFETSDNIIDTHTKDDVFKVKYKLYELEEIVPPYFLRVSKSTILNTHEVYSISRNLTASSIVEFKNSIKKVYVSRNYYKELVEKMNERMIRR